MAGSNRGTILRYKAPYLTVKPVCMSPPKRPPRGRAVQPVQRRTENTSGQRCTPYVPDPWRECFDGTLHTDTVGRVCSVGPAVRWRRPAKALVLGTNAPIM